MRIHVGEQSFDALMGIGDVPHYRGRANTRNTSLGTSPRTSPRNLDHHPHKNIDQDPISRAPGTSEREGRGKTTISMSSYLNKEFAGAAGLAVASIATVFGIRRAM